MLLSLLSILSVFRMAVIPVQFEDRKFVTKTDFLGTNIQKAQDYFDSQYKGAKTFSFELMPCVTLSHKTSYYGSNYSDRRDVLLHEAVREACRLSSSHIDFSAYDNNRDGKVDNIMLIIAGPSEDQGAGEEFITQQFAQLSAIGSSLSLGKVVIDNFAVVSELDIDSNGTLRPNGYGIFCHEFAHVLGLKDLYDVDGEASEGKSDGLQNTALMDGGCRKGEGNSPPGFNAIDLEALGLGHCDTLSIGSYTLPPLSIEQRYLKAPSAVEGEYYLFECRSRQGYDSALEQPGLYIYHIDKSDNPAGISTFSGRELTAGQRWETQQINCNPRHPCAKLVGILPSQELSTFSSMTEPSFRYWSGKTSQLALSNISIAHDGSVSFKVIEPVVLSEVCEYQDAITLRWQSDKSLRERVQSYRVEWIVDADTLSAQVPKNYSYYTIEGLKSSTAYKIKINAIVSPNEAYSTNVLATTKLYRKGTHPYIYLKDVIRGKDGSFIEGSKLPLRIYNAENIAYVDWYLDGNSISLDSNGYYQVSRPGILRAVIIYRDGTSEQIIKEIRL